MRLIGPVYECVPLIYAAIGGLAWWLAYLDPHGLGGAFAPIIGLAAEVAALTIYLKRRDDRELRSQYRGDSLEAPSRMEG
jgi:hypothetical protein